MTYNGDIKHSALVSERTGLEVLVLYSCCASPTAVKVSTLAKNVALLRFDPDISAGVTKDVRSGVNAVRPLDDARAHTLGLYESPVN